MARNGFLRLRPRHCWRTWRRTAWKIKQNLRILDFACHQQSYLKNKQKNEACLSMIILDFDVNCFFYFFFQLSNLTPLHFKLMGHHTAVHQGLTWICSEVATLSALVWLWQKSVRGYTLTVRGTVSSESGSTANSLLLQYVSCNIKGHWAHSNSGCALFKQTIQLLCM